MRTTTITLHTFSELDNDVQKKVLVTFSDINTDYDWWDFAYEDAKMVGIIPKGFNLGRGNNYDADIADCYATANLILKNHGDMCNTYTIATAFTREYDMLVEKYSDGVNSEIVAQENEDDFDNEVNTLENLFKKDIKAELLTLLIGEYDYKTSDEAIKKTIESNEYEFLIDGTQF